MKVIDEAAEAAVAKKVYRRLTWFLMMTFVFSYLDRSNINFAALAMNKDLGLTATMFGFANSVFYIAYVAAEIPSNIVMARVGARLWIPRIMITWGLASAATMFAVGPNSLYVLRALTGLAEAGFLPGVLLYITYWYPPSYRARATALFIMAQPITQMIGYPISGLILDLNGLGGLAGWKWLFLLEGIPSVFVGIWAYFYLADRPAQATWLSEQECIQLQSAIARDDEKVQPHGASDQSSVWRELASIPVLLLSLAYFGLVISLVSNATWVPQMIRGFVTTQNFVTTGLVAAVPPLMAILTMPFWGRHSDATQERKWHVALPMILTAGSWMVVALADRAEIKFAGLIFVSIATFAAQGIFWALASNFLSTRARPIGLAAINTFGLLGSTAGPLVVGFLRDQTGSFTEGLLFVTCSILIGAACVLTLSREGAEFPHRHDLGARTT
jgi:ACS family 4-hydroxyphenylacetate permease-like MFS transporter